MEVTPSGAITLLPIARHRLVGHQAGVLAEALGTAAGCLLATRFLHPGMAVTITDLENPSLPEWWLPAAGQRTRPDLWLRDSATFGAVVETKGSTTNLPISLLAAGTRQLNGDLRHGTSSLPVERWLCASYGIKSPLGLRAAALWIPSSGTSPLPLLAPEPVQIGERAVMAFPSGARWATSDRRRTASDLRDVIDGAEWATEQLEGIACRGRRTPVEIDHDLFLGVTEQAFEWLVDRRRYVLEPRQLDLWRNWVQLGRDQDDLSYKRSERWTTPVTDMDDMQVSAISAAHQAVAIIRR